MMFRMKVPDVAKRLGDFVGVEPPRMKTSVTIAIIIHNDEMIRTR